MSLPRRLTRLVHEVRSKLTPSAAFALALALALSAAVPAGAAAPDAPFDLSGLPPYRPAESVHGVIRIHGTELTLNLVRLWERGFLKHQPVVRYGDYFVPTAFSGLAAGTADIGVMGHTAWRSDLKAFEGMFGYDPFEIMFATGGFNLRKGNTPGAIVFVNRANPLTRLTLRQLDGILGAERSGGWVGTTWHPEVARGPEGNLRTWGQLGLTGAWANQPIHIYGIDATLSNWSELIQRVVFHGGDKWNPAIRELVRGGVEIPADAQIVSAVADDPYAIGFNLMRIVEKNPGVKALALAARDEGPFIAPTRESFYRRTYPLDNAVYLYLNRKPGQPLSPRLREFLTYVLSRDGQADVVEDGMYLPLTPEAAAAELAKLNPADRSGALTLALASESAPAPAPTPAPVPAPDPTHAPTHASAAVPASPWPPEPAAPPEVVDPAIGRLPDYRPTEMVSGTLRSWGNDRMASLMARWEEGFRVVQPGVRFTDRLKGTASAPFGLYEWVADLALMGRQIYPYEYYGVYRRSLLAPVEIAVATGSFDRPHESPALAVFVHRDNPLTQLTLTQLDRIFGAARTGGWQGLDWHTEVARTDRDNIRTWGQLGLTGAWADRPIHVYGPPGIYPGGVSFFQTRVFGGADSWNEQLREYADREQMMAALSADPDGIAYAGLGNATPAVKALALAEKSTSPAVTLTRAHVADRTYPLTRTAYIYFAPDQPNGDPADPKVDPKVREFLSYVLSRQGQEAVARDGNYLPLTAALAAAQREKLK